jgi:hypothetical protein
MYVAEALAEKYFPPEQAKTHREKLDEILSQLENEAVYNSAMWVNSIGFKLTVTVLETPDHHINNTANNAEIPV